MRKAQAGSATKSVDGWIDDDRCIDIIYIYINNMYILYMYYL